MQFNSDPKDFHRQLNELATQIGARRIGVCSLDQDEALDYLDRYLHYPSSLGYFLDYCFNMLVSTC